MKTTPIFVGVIAFALTLQTKGQSVTDSLKVQQLDEVFLSDSKTNLPSQYSGKIVKKITQKQLESMQGLNLTNIIDRIVGIELSGSKSLTGQNISYKVRGGRSKDVVVLVDGVVVSDPSAIDGEFDFRFLKSDQIKSIEILRGASSTLYGSGASTAVINITLKAAQKNKINLNVNSTLGTNQVASNQNNNINDFREQVNLNGTFNKFYYNLNFGHQYSDGISALASDNESDAFALTNKRVELGYKIDDAVSVRGFIQDDNLITSIDDTSDLLSDYKYFSDQFRTGVHADYVFNNGFVKMNYSYAETERLSESSFGNTIYESISSFSDIYANYDFEKLSVIAGFNLSNNKSKYDDGYESFQILDPYVNAVYKSPFGLNINAGLRLNNHSEYGSNLIYSFNPSFNLSLSNNQTIKWLASYSTAYIAPTLDQLFGPWGSNLNLDPEDSHTIEAGFVYDINLSNYNLDFSLLYFSRSVTDFIDYDFNSGYFNSDADLKTEGLEFDSTFSMGSKFRILSNFTYINIKEGSALRIPDWKLNSSLVYNISDTFSTTLAYQYNASRDDVYFENFMSVPIEMNTYSLFDIHLNKSFKNNKVKIYLAAINILNESFQEIVTYNAPGRNYRLGVTLSL